MRIWAHTLFKNSERWLWYSVTSVIEHVDKILLWDTASTDNSWKIASILKNIYPQKISLRQYGKVTVDTFFKARQAMLDQTDADWFIVVDDDEIWWEDSAKKVIAEIKTADNETESLVVPTVNVVGDIYHKQPTRAGNYKFGDKVGHYNLRAVRRNIDGLHSRGLHGIWGWADKNNQQIQNRNSYKFIDAPYLHTTFLPRTSNIDSITNVPKRYKKIKYEIGQILPFDYYYPESFFKYKPTIVPSVWQPMSKRYRLKAMIQTPLKNIKRRFKNEKVGY